MYLYSPKCFALLQMSVALFTLHAIIKELFLKVGLQTIPALFTNYFV